jgi:D-apionolactonase
MWADMQLRAGPLSLFFDPHTGWIRYLRAGRSEVLHGIYCAVRDTEWRTVLPRISGLSADVQADSFTLAFNAECIAREVDYLWHGTICGSSDGRVEFRMEGEARSFFFANRIGLCVLHPVSGCCGTPFTCLRTDDTQSAGEFPVAISPHQPVKDVASIAHQVAPGLTCTVRFEGDVFEMEDQRNWTDASYKTYSRPIALPKPYPVAKGDRVRQSVVMELSGTLPEFAAPVESELVELSAGGAPMVPLPQIGLGIVPDGPPADERRLQALQAMRLSHLRVNVALAGGGWRQVLPRAASESAALSVPLFADVFTEGAAGSEIEDFAAEVRRSRWPVSTWMVFGEGNAALRSLLAQASPGSLVAGGSPRYFAELNRERPQAGAFDALCYPLCPQVHAFDDTSLMETLQIHSVTVNNAQAFAAGRPILVGPVTLVAPGLRGVVDPRLQQPFGAAWTLGSLKYLGEAGAAAVTYFETSGPSGVLPDGEPTAISQLLEAIGEFAGGNIVPSQSAEPLRAVSLVLAKNGRVAWFVANLTATRQRVRVHNIAELDLFPYGVAIVREPLTA